MYVLVSGDEVDTESVWGIKEEENRMEISHLAKTFNHHPVIHF